MEIQPSVEHAIPIAPILAVFAVECATIFLFVLWTWCKSQHDRS